MSVPGIHTLVAATITDALTSQIYDAVTGLDSMATVVIEAVFTYGSGGTSAVVRVQTSLDGGTTWRDVGRIDFATASRAAHATLSGRLSKAVTTYAALNAEGVYDGVLGDRLRAVVTTVGTYAGSTTLAVRARVL